MTNRRKQPIGGRLRAPIRVALMAVAIAAGTIAGLPAVASGASPEAPLTTPVPSPDAAATTVRVAPARLQITSGETSTIELKVDTAVPAVSVVADVAFDKSVLKIRTIELGAAWSGATILTGGAVATLADAIAQANEAGVLTQVGVFLMADPATLPTGESVFVTITVEGLTDGSTSLAVTGATVLGSLGEALPVTLDNPGPGDGQGQSGGTAGTDGEGGIDSLLIVALAVIVAVVGGVVVYARSGSQNGRSRDWPFGVSLALALIPVLMFAGLVLMLVLNSLPVLVSPGLGSVFSDRFSSAFSLGGNNDEFGLIPAVWGTLQITAIAIGLALPVSVALAIIATEFPMGPIGRVLRPLLGVLSGIPPIVYAVAGAVFVTIFMAPKFAGSADFSSFDPGRLGVMPANWPPADVPFGVTAFPWPPNVGGIPNSTLLGGILIALLVIPFMTPLIFDAMRNIPSAAKEASFALGASRGYTLRRVILPLAMPGIVAAVALATLKALGDVLIVALVVGWQAETIPVPIVDVLERTSTLAAEGANLLGNLQSGAGASCSPGSPACAVGYFSALLLLVIAAAVVIAAHTLEARLRRKLQT